jgi:VWFA-related protein
LLSTLVALPAATQQPPQFGERVEVNAVLIDAIVTDSKGNQILGLEKQDFLVTENGQAQEIDSVDYFTTRRLLTGPEHAAAFKVERVQEQRYFLIFFDKMVGATLFDRFALARRAAEDFVNRDVGENDFVAVVGHDVRLKVYSDFTSNRKKLIQAIRDTAMFSKGISKADKNSGPSILRGMNSAAMIGGTGTVYQAIMELANAVEPIRGKKNLIVFSPGIVEPGEEIRNGILLSSSRYYDPMVEALNDANVSVYAANVILDQMEPAYHQTLQRMSLETNGDYFRNNVSFQNVFRGVEKSSSGYYLLTYRTRKAPETKGFQKVQVKVRNQPELRVQARSGYNYGG